MSKKTTKQKLDEILGIQSDQSVDDFLNELQVEDMPSEVPEAMDEIKDKVAENIELLDNQLSSLQTAGTNGPVLMKDLDSTMCEIEELISLSKKMFKHVYESICSSDLIDSELVSSISKLLEGIHINIAEFISLYKDKQRYVDKVRLMIFQQEQRKELMNIKHQQEIEKIKLKQQDNVVDADGDSVYNQDYVIKMLEKYDQEQAEESQHNNKIEQAQKE